MMQDTAVTVLLSLPGPGYLEEMISREVCEHAAQAFRIATDILNEAGLHRISKRNRPASPPGRTLELGMLWKEAVPGKSRS